MTRSQAEDTVRAHVRQLQANGIIDAASVGAEPEIYFVGADTQNNQIIETINGPLHAQTVENMINDVDPVEWTFFVDDMPTANWEHSCRYLFVHSSGKISDIEETAPPSSGQNLVMEHVSHASPDD